MRHGRRRLEAGVGVPAVAPGSITKVFVVHSWLDGSLLAS